MLSSLRSHLIILRRHLFRLFFSSHLINLSSRLSFNSHTIIRNSIRPPTRWALGIVLTLHPFGPGTNPRLNRSSRL
jgi:hypothetical protein